MLSFPSLPILFFLLYVASADITGLVSDNLIWRGWWQQPLCMEAWDTWSPPSTSEGSPQAEAACSSFLGLLEQNTIISVSLHSSGGQKPENEVSAMLVPCGAAEGESRASLPASGAAGSAGRLLAYRHITHASVCLDMALSPV